MPHGLDMGATQKRVFIMPGTHIEDRCIISACSVVGGKIIPANTILGGYPARKIGMRPS